MEKLTGMKREDTLDFHYRKIWHNIARIYNNRAADHGITMSAGFALLSIEKEGTPSTHLGPKMGMEPRSLTRMLKTLEDRSWIFKKKDSVDGRVVRIFLTELGQKKRKLAADAVKQFNTKVQNKLSQKELDGFFAFCTKMDSILDSVKIFEDEENN